MILQDPGMKESVKKTASSQERYLNYKNMPVEEASNQLIRLAIGGV